MNEAGTTYYRIRKRILGKKEDGEYFLFLDETWTPDTESVILDTMFGYDPYEKPGSPYAMYNTDIMEELEQISEEQADAMIRNQTGKGGY